MADMLKNIEDISKKKELAYNTYLYAVYLLTDRQQDDMFGTGLAFAF